jgi:signal transduction histidine kinase
MNHPYKSLKRQILFRLFVISALAFIIVEAIILEQSYRALNSALDNGLKARADSLATLAEVESGGQVEFEFGDQLMRDFSGPNPRAYFLILHLPDNKEIRRSESLGSESLHIPVPTENITPEKPFFWNTHIRNQSVRCIALRTSPHPASPKDQQGMSEQENYIASSQDSTAPVEKSDEVLLLAALVRSDTDRQFAEILKLTSAALGIGLFLLLLSSWFVVLHSLKPLRELEKQVQVISARNLIPVNVPSIKEIASVTHALNRLINDLKDAFQRERRFTADVAHELRTPIAELRSLAEVALKWPDRHAEQQRKNYEDILASVKQMQNIVTTLLTLTRCDAGALTSQKENLHLETIINVTWQQFETRAIAKHLAINSNVPSELSIVTDRELFATILANLFSNAVEYTPDGGKIEWKAALENSEFSFSISNTTTELTQQDLPLMFERFWQKEKSRSHSDAHSGLGLALVRSLVTILGFTIEAQLMTPSVLIITLSETSNKHS